MSYSNKFYEVSALLGCGLSVQTICERTGISFDDLCHLAEEYNELKIQLERWYPRYDFNVLPEDEPEQKQETVNDKVTETDITDIKEEEDEGTEGISAGKQVSRKPKGKSK
jgi:hypothetical protein